MKIKPGVSIQGLDIKMRRVLIAASKIWDDLDQELVITSGNENVTHSPGSLHPYGLALDFRTRYFSDLEQRSATVALVNSLGHHYDVVLEKDHMHVEYDE